MSAAPRNGVRMEHRLSSAGLLLLMLGCGGPAAPDEDGVDSGVNDFIDEAVHASETSAMICQVVSECGFDCFGAAALTEAQAICLWVQAGRDTVLFAEYWEALDAHARTYLACLEEGCGESGTSCAPAPAPILQTPPAFLVEAGSCILPAGESTPADPSRSLEAGALRALARRASTAAASVRTAYCNCGFRCGDVAALGDSEASCFLILAGDDLNLFADYFEALEARSISLLACIDEMGCGGASRGCVAAAPEVLRTPPRFVVDATLACYE